ncbi:MAG TPA: S1 RNA-binding domain-containing protein [Anaerolineaceae bacterium]|nr:S1 RNA-binding domain-containing protein [Anaerolineaceae bacterium]
MAVADRQNEIKPKAQYTGKVVKTSLAGAIVDIGAGRPAILHVSQIIPPEDGQPIKSVSDVLQEGQEVNVWVRRIRDDRVELTMFKPLDLEWREIKKNMVVKGKVVRLEGFGAFVDIGAERPGLIHISELAHGYVRTPADVVKEEDEVEAMVIDVNRKKKQIKLSLKALQPEPVIEQTERQAETFPKREKTVRRTKKAPTRRRTEDGVENIDELMQNINEPVQEAEPTAMEIAIREAMERAKARKQEDKKKKDKNVSSEQDELLSRTLENKAGSSS